ncbi:MAG: hypothetical protein L0H88_06815 [Propionibacterium sp.]|nr:hypothetical protein [Propionibacterium sp.]
MSSSSLEAGDSHHAWGVSWMTVHETVAPNPVITAPWGYKGRDQHI